jgi:methenyltetrahydrofolate cyclohydrolase
MRKKYTRSPKRWLVDMITQSSIDEFLGRLASADATPGGGSAAAIMGAMGAALVSMVCNVSIGKKGYEAVEAELQAVRAQSEERRLQLAAMVAEDVAAFDSLMAAYKLPKATEHDRARRAAEIQASLRRATEVPLDCARVCAEVIGLARRAGEHGYRGVISDGGVGALAAYAAARSAALNVYINAPALKDRDFAQASIAELEKLLVSCAVESEAAYTIVRNKLET